MNSLYSLVNEEECSNNNSTNISESVEQRKYFLGKRHLRNMHKVITCNSLNCFNEPQYYLSTNNNNLNHNKKPITILYQNIQYLSNQDQLENLTDEVDPEMKIIAEHGMKESNIELAVPKRFLLKSEYCRSIYREGGTALYTNDKISKFVENLEWISETSVEDVGEK